MRPHTAVLSAVFAVALAHAPSLPAQQPWKAIIIVDKPVRAVPPTLSVDTQRVVREADGTFVVSLRWTSGADATLASRTDRIERHRLDCRGRRSTFIAGFIVPVREGKESSLVRYSDTEPRSLGFQSNPPESEFFDSVCQWAQKAVPGND